MRREQYLSRGDWVYLTGYELPESWKNKMMRNPGNRCGPYIFASAGFTLHSKRSA